MANGTKFQDYLSETLLDADFAAEFLTAALEEGDEAFLSEALAQVVRIHGSSKLAGETGIARQALYKMLSREGNPSFKNVQKLLNAVGLELTVKVKGRAS